MFCVMWKIFTSRTIKVRYHVFLNSHQIIILNNNFGDVDLCSFVTPVQCILELKTIQTIAEVGNKNILIVNNSILQMCISSFLTVFLRHIIFEWSLKLTTVFLKAILLMQIHLASQILQCYNYIP